MSLRQNRISGLFPSVSSRPASLEIPLILRLAQNIFPEVIETRLISLYKEVITSRLSLFIIPEPERSLIFDLTIPEIFKELNTDENQTRNSDLIIFIDNSTIDLII